MSALERMQQAQSIAAEYGLGPGYAEMLATVEPHRMRDEAARLAKLIPAAHPPTEPAEDPAATAFTDWVGGFARPEPAEHPEEFADFVGRLGTIREE